MNLPLPGFLRRWWERRRALRRGNDLRRRLNEEFVRGIQPPPRRYGHSPTPVGGHPHQPDPADLSRRTS